MSIEEILSHRIDLKGQTIDHFDYVLKESSKFTKESNPEFTDIGLKIFTSFAIISGELVSLVDFPKEEDRSSFQNFLVKSIDLRNKYINDLKEVQRITNDSSFILLKDVTITPYTHAGIGHKVHELVLFTDQIVGMSCD